MTDRYTELINTPVGKKIAGALGLPKPVPLKRYSPDEPQITGSLVAIGQSETFESIVKSFVDEGVDVRRHLEGRLRPSAVLIGLDHVSSVGELDEILLSARAAIKALDRHGRVIVISPAPDSVEEISAKALAFAATGFVRSLAHELRNGATANGVLLQGGGAVAPDSAVMSVVRFFLSARSVFVSGQFLSVDQSVRIGYVDRVHPLDGKTAVVTGAARGIGAEIARTLARDGATVFGVDIPAAGDALARVCNEIGAVAIQADITAADAAEKILATVAQRGSTVDIVIHNAGITRDKLFVNMSDDQWESVLDVNLASQLRFNETFIDAADRGENPRIVTLASTSGIAGNRGQTNYAASKAGVMGMVEASAATFAAQGGTINAVAPGFIETEMTAKIPFATREVARRLNSLQQGGRPSDVAEVVAFLASDAAAGVNGQTLRVCGQNLVGA